MSDIKYFGSVIDDDTLMSVISDHLYVIETYCGKQLSRYPLPNPMVPHESSAYADKVNVEKFERIHIKWNEKVAIDLEFAPDRLPLDKKIRLLKECPSIIPFFSSFDLTLFNYILYNNDVCLLNNCTMGLERIDVTKSLIKWIATVPQYDNFYYGRVCNLVRQNINRLVDLGEIQEFDLVTHFWGSFFDSYGEELKYRDYDNISGDRIPGGKMYQDTPTSRFLSIFDITYLESRLFTEMFKHYIEVYEVLPNYLNAILRLNYGDHDYRVQNCLLYFMCYSIMKPDMIDRMGLKILSNYDRKVMFKVLNENSQVEVVKKTVNYLKLKYPELNIKELFE